MNKINEDLEVVMIPKNEISGDSNKVLNGEIEIEIDLEEDATAVITSKNWSKSKSPINSSPIKESADCELKHIIFKTDLLDDRNNALQIFENIEKNDSSYLCSVCGRNFSRNYTLQNHLLSHTTIRIHNCPLCSKSYKSKSDLTRHLHSHSQQTFNCKICQKVFRSKNLLGDHVRGVHQQKILQCDLCKKTLKSLSGFRRHQMSHDLERPFQCAHCESSFKHKSILKKHLLNHMPRVS